MFPLGFALATLGLYLVDCAYTNRPPLATLKAMISDPAKFRAELASSKGTGPISTSVSGAGSSSSPAPLTNLNGTFDVPSGATGTAIAFARRQIGKPYQWGATGPNSFDCSGLTYTAFLAAGVNIGRTTYQQILHGHAVAKSALIPGDLVFPDAGHVQIYTGNGMVVEAPHTGAFVREVPMWGFWAARRVA